MDLRDKLKAAAGGKRDSERAPRRMDSHLPADFMRIGTEEGDAFVLERVFPLAHVHGRCPLADVFATSSRDLSLIGKDPSLLGLDIGNAVFLDTETTGLAGGSGTIAFLIGLGFFSGESFYLHQYFLPDYNYEKPMLLALGDFLERFSGIVSFNGKTFDLNLLRTRFIMNRIPYRLEDLPHLDLIHASRRLWKDCVSGCSLVNLEREILGFRRKGDIPGELIPALYFEYLKSGDFSRLEKVMHHNRLDILSLVAVAQRIGYLLRNPAELSPGELFGLGKLYESLGDVEKGVACLEEALKRGLTEGLRLRALKRLSFLYKRSRKWNRAREIWDLIIEREGIPDLYPHIEMAKYLEHQEKDYEAAIEKVRQAWDILHQKKYLLSTLTLEIHKKDLKHRLERLRRKSGQ